ncbi:hypothetical protein GCM10025780_24150 [Frondihabitans cladoniiphilus]|uniref:Uncharacterized protein n=1 Tax=Frondihabitans cladoniiphilus TaxID=715785 RepID=A0ABP8W426_9MICO
MLRRPPQSHPWAHGSFGFWVVQQPPSPPLGYVITENRDGVWILHSYAYCRDDGGRRPWLKTGRTLNSVVAWMIQHEADIRRLIARSHPEPDELPGC